MKKRHKIFFKVVSVYLIFQILMGLIKFKRIYEHQGNYKFKHARNDS